MKKLVSMIVMFGLIASQIGCAGKVAKISAPLDQVKFEKDYKYTVTLKTGDRSKEIMGQQIQGKKNQLILNSSTQSKSFMSQDIRNIDGVSISSDGSYALQGLIIGAVAIGIPAGIVMGFTAKTFSESEYGDGGSVGHYIRVGLISSLIGAAGGGLIGLGIGALIPKHNKVQITPVITPTTSGVDAGVNVGFKF